MIRALKIRLAKLKFRSSILISWTFILLSYCGEWKLRASSKGANEVSDVGDLKASRFLAALEMTVAGIKLNLESI